MRNPPKLKGNMETTEAEQLHWRDKRLQVRHASARQGNLPSQGPMAHCKHRKAEPRQTPGRCRLPSSVQKRTNEIKKAGSPSSVVGGSGQG